MRYSFLWIGLLWSHLTLTAQMSPEQWRADIALLKKELPARNPDLFTKYTRSDFEKDLNDLSQNLGNRPDLQIGLYLQALVSKTADAQTRLDLKTMLQHESPIPFGLGWYADGLYVSGTVTRFEKALGKKVLQVNGIPVKEALSRLAAFSPVENEYGLHYDVLNWFRFPTAFKMAGISQTDTLGLVLEAKSGIKEFIKVFPIALTRRNDMMPVQIQQEKKDIRWQPAYGVFSLQYLPDDSVMYVQYNRCVGMEMALAQGADSASARQYPPFQPLVDSLFRFMQANPRAKLFFDLRFNFGGDPADGIRFAQKLATIPSVNRKEKLFVAVNLYTSGAAVDVASQFRATTKATLIGDPPGSSPSHFTELHNFTLPNSQITVSYATKYKRVNAPDPLVLKPDVLLELSFDDFKAGRDPVLDYVRKH